MPVTKVKSKWSSGNLIFYKLCDVAGETGRPFMVDVDINAAMGGWSNAFKAMVTYGASGKTTGLGSAINAEMSLSAGCTAGTYAALEAELVADTGALTGAATSFIYCNATDTAGTVNDNGFLFHLGVGLTSGSGHLWYDKGSAITTGDASEWIRVQTPGGTRYLMLYDSPS